jgi:predicted porin
MKKHVLALAVAAAIPTIAAAQNVSVYGHLDHSIGSQNTAGGVTTTSNFNSIVGTSVIGFRGSEDLGGGLKANFQLEGSINTKSGEVGKDADTRTDASFAPPLFNREAWVGISGGFGELRFGVTDVTRAQGVDATIATLGNLNDFVQDLGSDTQNTIRYISPVASGFQFEAGYANSATTAAKGSTDVTSASLAYVNGPLTVLVGHTIADLTATTKDTQTAVGVNYDMGVARLGVAMNRIDSDTAASDNKESIVSVVVPLGGGLDATASYNKRDRLNGDDGKIVTAGFIKTLSKRTGLYAAYQNNNNTTTADVTNFYVGLRHSF